MKIPLLENFFGVCSLETGTKIIAYIQLAMLTLVTITLCILASEVFVTVKDVDKKVYNDKTFPTDVSDSEIDMYEKSKAAILGFGIAVFIVAALVLIILYTATIFLLLGVYKKRPSYMIFWLVLAVIVIIGSIRDILSPKGIFSLIVNLFFTWVVYSHYRELTDNLESPAGLSHRQAKSQGVFVTVATPSAPPPYTSFMENPSYV